MDGHAYLSLCCLHKSYYRFCRALAHFEISPDNLLKYFSSFFPENEWALAFLGDNLLDMSKPNFLEK